MSITENLFQSIDTIVSQRLNEVSFDKTEICEIIQQDLKTIGKYLVSNGSIKYDAYSDDENRNYLKGSKVYVRITNGDYSLRKIITGSYVEEETTKDLYTNPFDYLVSSNRIALVGENSINIKTNGEPKVNLDSIPVEFNYNNSSSFDYIGLEFAFNTNITGYQGIYALEIYLCDENDIALHKIPLVFSSKQLYGNPYSLNSVLKYQHLFPWPQFNDDSKRVTDIKKIKGALLQNGEFATSNQDIELVEANLYFGYDVKQVASNELTLSLKDGEQLYYNSDEDVNFEHNFYLDWKYINPSGKAYIFNEKQKPEESTFDYYQVYWLHYIDGSGENDSRLPNQYAWNWKTIESNTEFNQKITLTTFYKTDQYKVVIEYAEKLTADQKNNIENYNKDKQNYFEWEKQLEKNPDNEELKENISNFLALEKEVLSYYSYVISTGIIFENRKTGIIPSATNNSGDSLRLSLENGDTGVYNIYGLDGNMANTFYKNSHYITFEFFDNMSIDNIDNITWFFPKDNTMIVPQNAISDDEYPSYLIIRDKQATTVEFSLKTRYAPGAMNNTIECMVELNTGEIRRGSLTLQFGEISTAGSNYSLNIDFLNNRTCLYAEQGDSIEVQATFTKQNGEVVTPPTIKWGWLNEEESINIIEDKNDNKKVTLEFKQSNLSNQNFAILTATAIDYALDNELKSDLVAYLPIPIAAARTRGEEQEYSYISGATRVVYDSNGNQATFSKDPYKLYERNNGILQEVTGVTWKIEKFNNQTESPVLQEYNDEYTLIPLAHAPTEIPKICIYCVDNNDQTLWSQPLLIIQQRWEYSMLNDWNGELTSGENYILAPIIGAGKKDDQNSFTGVMMGDLKTTNGKTMNTGLYGFNQGARRFSFDDTGSAYIGNGASYIEFIPDGDGNNDIFTIKTDNVYISNTPEKLEGPIVRFGDGFQVYDNGSVRIGGDKTEIDFPTTYLGTQSLTLSQEDINTNWYSSEDAVIKAVNEKEEAEYESWQEYYLYLWTRIKASEESYNYSYRISSNALTRTEYSNDQEDWYNNIDNENINKNETIYYRKIRYMKVGDEEVVDIYESPIVLPRGIDGAPGKDGAQGPPGADGKDGAPGKDGTSPYTISFNNDYDTLVRGPDGQLINSEFTIDVQYFTGDIEVTDFSEGEVSFSNSGNIAVAFTSTDGKFNYNQLKITIKNSSIDEGEVTVTWQNVSKTFKFKIIDGTEDYDLIVSPQVINVDALGNNGKQVISIQIKDSKGKVYDWSKSDNIPDGTFQIEYTFDGNIWVTLAAGNSLEFGNTNSKLGIKLYYTKNFSDFNNYILFDEEQVEAIHNGLKGDSGNSLQVIYKDSDSQPETPQEETLGEWTTTIPETIEYRIYMSQKLSNETTWSIPIPLSGEQGPQGDPGKDGSDIEYVYYQSDSSEAPDTPSYSNGQLTDEWTTSPQGVSKDYKYEYVSVRTKAAGSKNWSEFSIPVIWSKWGEKGQDGDGIKYVYCRINDTTPPQYPTPDDEEYIWTEEPKGVNEDYPYEYVVQIKVENGTLVYPEGVKGALWSKWSKDGKDATDTLASSQLVYFDSGDEYRTIEQVKKQDIYKTLDDAVSNFTDSVFNGDIGFVGIVTEFTDNNNNSVYGSYSYETYVSFVQKNTNGILIDANNISGVENALITRLLGTNIIRSENYGEMDETGAVLGTEINLYDGSINSSHFKVDQYGSIYATGGNIGGFSVNGDRFGSQTINGTEISSIWFTSVPSSHNGYFIECSQTNSDNYFKVDKQGRIYATGAEISGKITATSGTIGGWELRTRTENETTYSYLGTAWGGANAVAFISQGGTPAAVSIDNTVRDCHLYLKGKFAVDTTGTLYATNAVISGTITAGSGGNIGGWSVLRDTEINGAPTSSVLYSEWVSAWGDTWTVKMTGLGAQAQTLNVGSTAVFADWYDIITNGSGSDERLKDNILELSEKYDIFFNSLKPKTFSFKPESNQGDPNLTHFGFIAQDVLESCQSNNIKLSLIYNTDFYKLRYNEFIALNTWQIQKLKARVTELEQEIKEIKQKNEI